MLRIQNEKNLVASSALASVMTVTAVTKCRHYLDTAGRTHPNHDAWDKILSLIEKLPVANITDLYHDDDISKKSSSTFEPLPCHCINQVDRFVTSSANLSHPASITDDLSTWGWDDLEILASSKTSKLMEELVAAAQIKVMFKQASTKTALKQKNKVQDGQWRVTMHDPVEELVEVNAFAIYQKTSDRHQGYLDGRGALSPLAGARLFESAAAAHTTKKSRGLTNAVVVCVKASLTGIAPDQETSTSFDELAKAMAILERRALEQALEQATVEQLQERLDQAQAKLQQAGLEEPPSSPSMSQAPAKPRRM